MSSDHELLMEALMLFSSEESDCSSALSEGSDIETKADAPRQVQHTSSDGLSDRQDDDSLLDSAVDDVLYGLSMSQQHEGESRTKRVQVKRTFGEHIQVSAHDTPRYGRKRSKKCTYAARRQEVSWLKSLALKLDMQLEYFQQQPHHQNQRSRYGDNAMHRLEFERQQLANSQVENARLRALVEANEVRVRQLQAAMRQGSPQSQ